MIYLDNAATTMVSKEIVDTVSQYLNINYGNPSSLHSFGKRANIILDNSRKEIASCINCKDSEIYFTSGGTEANNIAIIGYMKNKKGKHIITTSIEHKATINSCKYLEQIGYKVTYIKPNKSGIILTDDVINAICNDTELITMMMVNNEIGTIQPIREISKLSDICLHVDAIQGFGHLPIDVNELGIDMMSISGHKIHAPKGIGALYIRKGIEISPIIYGGGQEEGLRSGTENVSGIACLGKAAIMAKNNVGNNQIRKLSNKLIYNITSNLEDVKLNGCINNRVPHIVNLCFEDVDAESLLLLLDMNNIYVSSGAACSSNDDNVFSHVLESIGLSESEIRCSLRISLSRYTTEYEIDEVVKTIILCVNKLRNMY